MAYKKYLLILILITQLIIACGQVDSNPPATDKIRVVATTTIVGDVVKQVGGNQIDLTILFPPGADPHTFEPRPQDVAIISKSDVIVVNGLGLEEALEPILESNANGLIVVASEGVDLLAFGTSAQDHDHGNADPHTWTDPNNVMIWAENIAAALAEADPANAEFYRSNADDFIEKLHDLDDWIRIEVGNISPERRLIVTDHQIFAYFGEEYGLEQVGTVVGAYSTNASPSAQEMAELVNRIQTLGVPAVFVGNTINPSLAEQVSRDTGTALVFLFTGSLSEPGQRVDSYLKYMRYNVNAIVEALK